MKSVVIAIHLISFGQVILNLVSAQSHRACFALTTEMGRARESPMVSTDLSILARIIDERTSESLERASEHYQQDRFWRSGELEGISTRPTDRPTTDCVKADADEVGLFLPPV